MAAEQRLENFEAQHISNTAWGFGTLGQYNERLFAALAKAAEQRLKDFSTQAISNIAWAFAKAAFLGQSWDLLGDVLDITFG